MFVVQVRACLAEHRMSVDDHGGLDAMMSDIANQTEPVRQMNNIASSWYDHGSAISHSEGWRNSLSGEHMARYPAACLSCRLPPRIV
jgi:hypothetical protein